MKILALDLGTKTGWACQDLTLTSGMQKFENGRFSGGGMRFLKFKSWLTEMNDLVGGFDSVCFEEVRRHVGTTAAHVYGGLLGILTAWCEENKIPYQGYPVGTIKKFACSKGNASKEMMIESAKKKWPDIEIISDDHADALWILELHKNVMSL
jgi:Holliday junction resolvasome RuvABC endonuclease subunit